MTDTVLLEIPIEPSLLSVVRMVVGGMAARVDLSVDEIDDVYMAVEEILYAAHEKDRETRCGVRVSAGEGALTLEMGPFAAASIAPRLDEPGCSLIARVVALEVRPADGDGELVVVLTKRRQVPRS
jgi:hypothetical protein